LGGRYNAAVIFLLIMPLHERWAYSADAGWPQGTP
jgi:hypothetical protein